MEQKKQSDKKVQSKQQHKKTSELVKLLDSNQTIFKQLKDELKHQLQAYEQAFSRQKNKYTDDRDFDHFQKCSNNFKRKGRDFIDKLAKIKSNCSSVIKNLPQQMKLIPTQVNNTFDMFVNQQVEQNIQCRIRDIRYDEFGRIPFEKQSDSIFQQ